MQFVSTLSDCWSSILVGMIQQKGVSLETGRKLKDVGEEVEQHRKHITRLSGYADGCFKLFACCFLESRRGEMSQQTLLLIVSHFRLVPSVFDVPP